ncbi:MAG TPA: flagellar assembly protein FliH [Spirochaetia bacterium]|nr:flagellar assembly protein FliH [Spirochaetia bacterium]
MAKNVFRSQEIVELGTSILIEPPKVMEPVIEAVEPLDEYTGPTADDLRREAEAFKAQWEEEKATIIETAREEADAIIRQAEQTAFEEVKKQTDQAQKVRQEAQDEAKKLLDEARREADEERKGLDGQREDILEAARKEGLSQGREEGFEGGKAEVERLIELLHNIINTAIAKRTEIIEESETQLVNLVLLIAKKVVKVISENQKNVVVNNVIQALRKMKTRGDVAIKVNLADVKLTSEHIKDFMRMVENVRSVTVLEDSTVDPGGCLIETDFGQIDARISSQLHEIEERIIELAPIRVRGEQG